MLLPVKTGPQAGSRARSVVAARSRKTSELGYTTARIKIINEMLGRFSDVSSIYARKSWPTSGIRKSSIIINQRQAKQLFGSLALRILPEPESRLFERKDFETEKAAWMADVKSCLERLLGDLEGEKESIEDRY